ncbi:MAG: N-acetylmuramoyl-L-alanine amidase [Kiritimatiellae bacterium]|nr:N-acetylmuramoyl-L-alanine amidase [Kiritimatiellia bacterium]
MSYKSLFAIAALLAPMLALATPKHVTLAKVQKKLSLPIVEATTNLVSISDGTNSVIFHPGYRRAAVNGITVWLNEPADPDYKCTLKIGKPDLERLLVPILYLARAPGGKEAPPEELATTEEEQQGDTATRRPVFLDPGHGGDDAGAISAATGQKEKDLVLDVALRIGEILRDAGLEVVFSRTNDTFVSLSDRSTLAAEAGAALFVSVHANTTGGNIAQGIETFTLSFAESDSTAGDTRITMKEWPGNAYDAESTVLGYLVHSTVNTARGEADRGLRHARFQVLRQAPCPAILVECGFLSNEAENLSLESPRYRQRLATAIAKAILAMPAPEEKK